MNTVEWICAGLDKLVLRIGRIAMWSNALLLAVIILQVVMRYFFNRGMIMLEELQWHLYAAGIMTGASYAMVKDVHIRMDLVSSGFNAKNRSIIELLSIIVLLLPFLVITFHQSLDFVHESWRLGEESASPMGLPFRWAVKSLIPIGFGLMVLATLTRTARTVISLGRRSNVAE